MSLDELEALLAKATAGKWEVGRYGAIRARMRLGSAKLGGYFCDEDAAAIVAAVNWCRSEGIAAARERDRLREALQGLLDMPGNIENADFDEAERVWQARNAAWDAARTALAGQP